MANNHRKSELMKHNCEVKFTHSGAVFLAGIRSLSILSSPLLVRVLTVNVLPHEWVRGERVQLKPGGRVTAVLMQV